MSTRTCTNCGDGLSMKSYESPSVFARRATCGHRCAANLRRVAEPKERGKQSPEYHAWAQMIQRCENANTKAFKNYGGRGIKVCEQWHKAAAFLSDMGPRPSEGHSLDRINNDGDYEPSNCRWATKIQQVNNTRRNHLVEVDGRTDTLAATCARHGANLGTIRNRMKRRGLTAAEALVRPWRSRA